MEIDKQDIRQNVIIWATTKIQNDFKFREHQLEAIVDIIYNILTHGNHNYVIEAPTGSGKSLINVISAGVLADFYDMTSYILVSDLFLWEQYSNFLKKHDATGIAELKGKIGNYKCNFNGEDITLADCTLSGLSWASMYNPATIDKYGYDCAYTCPYVRARQKALKSKVCLMTYQLFVQTFKKLVNDDTNKYQFKQRDVIFCDECHNIPSIVENLCHLTIQLKDLDKILLIFDYIQEQRMSLFEEEDELSNTWIRTHTREDVIDMFNKLWNGITNTDNRKDEDNELMIEYQNMISNLIDICDYIYSTIMSLKKNHKHVSKEMLAVFKASRWFNDYVCNYNDYLELIKTVGSDYQLKEISKNQDDEVIVSFRCIKENYLVHKYLLEKASWKVMMSATIGGQEAFDENMGFDLTDDKCSIMSRIPSTFNFDESPVWFLNRFKMSMREREVSFMHLKNVIYSICTTKFANQRGIIQTGSYDFAYRLYKEAPIEVKQRMLVYNGSREKNTMIKIHQMSTNTILVGPTLNEGIDLPGDECRFIIIMKVPYPNLGDRYVKEKIKYFPLWYNSTTSNQIIQGIGRGIRYNGDWCVTYIFDACFQTLYNSTKEQYSEELQKRIKYI